jgi:hypothetical protein
MYNQNLFPTRTKNLHNSTTGKKVPPAHAKHGRFLQPTRRECFTIFYFLEFDLVVSSSKDVINKDDQADVIPPKNDEPSPVEMHHRVALGREWKIDHGGDAKVLVGGIFILIAGHVGRLP